MSISRELTLRVAVVNDYPLVTAGVVAMLAPFTDEIRVNQFAGTVPPAGSADVVLLDTFAAPNPIDRLTAVIEATRAPVLMFSWVDDQRLIDESLRAGAAGFCSKSSNGIELVAALRKVHSGGHHVDRVEPGQSALSGWPGQAQGLSAREGEIIALIATGLSNDEIAAACYLSINSIKTYVRSAYRKMGVKSRSQAVLWALDHEIGSRRDT